MIPATLSVLVIAVAMFSALREVIDLNRATDSWIYTWDLKWWSTSDAFHAYPFAETLGHVAATALIVLGIPDSCWLRLLYLPTYLYIFYQWRNAFIHQILPLSVKDELSNLQLAHVIAAIVLLVVFLIIYY